MQIQQKQIFYCHHYLLFIKYPKKLSKCGLFGINTDNDSKQSYPDKILPENVEILESTPLI